VRTAEQLCNDSDTTSNDSETKTSFSCVSDNIPDDISDEIPEIPRLKKHCFKSVALQADGFGVSDRAVAAIVSATLIDFGLEHMGPVDRNKIRRERKSLRSAYKDTDCRISGLYFDGREDQTKNCRGSQDCCF